MVVILFSLANLYLLRLGPSDRAVKGDLKQSDVTFSLRRQLLELSMMLTAGGTEGTESLLSLERETVLSVITCLGEVEHSGDSTVP